MSERLTPAQERWRSLTDEERRRATDINAARQAGYQLSTLLNDPFNKNEPWTQEEDEILLFSPKRTVDIAIALHRTYAQCSHRRMILRRAIAGEVRSYLPAHSDTDTGVINLAHCGICLGEHGNHVSWCPDAEEKAESNEEQA